MLNEPVWTRHSNCTSSKHAHLYSSNVCSYDRDWIMMRRTITTMTSTMMTTVVASYTPLSSLKSTQQLYTKHAHLYSLHPCINIYDHDSIMTVTTATIMRRRGTITTRTSTMTITVISSRVVATSPPLFSLKSAPQQLHTKYAHPLFTASMYQQLRS